MIIKGYDNIAHLAKLDLCLAKRRDGIKTDIEGLAGSGWRG